MSHFHFPKKFKTTDEFYDFLSKKIYPALPNPKGDYLELGAEFDPDFMIKRFHMREEFVKQFAWAIPSKEAVQMIVDFADDDEILEIGAGTGLWAWLISQAGGKILACDNTNITKCHYFNESASYFHPVVIVNDTIEFARNRSKCLLYCWPSYDAEWTGQSIGTLSPEKLIYIGEGWGGCTGDDFFHGTIQERYEQVGECRIPQWSGIHDHLTVYKKKY